MDSLKKILHIAPMNTSGVPGQFVITERKLGYESRLVTLYRDRRNYFEDICLDLPFITFSGTRFLKKYISAPQKILVDNRLRIPEKIPRVWRPHSIMEKLLIRARDLIWRARVEAAIRDHGLDQFEIVQLDGGLDFYRRPDFVPRMKAAGKKIICCYTGSDLRTRGVIEDVDAVADINVSVEFDHTMLHPNIHHVFFPFDASRFTLHRPSPGEDKVRIGHAPTQWAAKGSHVIVPILGKLAEIYPLEIVLIENLSYEKAIALKQNCDIFVDQIGDLGYGINSLEALAMGIATCSCLAPGFAEKYPDHPFVVINENNLERELIKLIKDEKYRVAIGERGRQWVPNYHDPVRVVKAIHRLAGII